MKLNLKELKEIARSVRKDTLIEIHKAGSGHPGGSLSCIEILIALYYCKLRHDPKRPDWGERDIFIMSKGHGCSALYAVLAYRGFFPRDELWTFRKLGSRLQGHAYRGVPGVEFSTGSLGQGLSVANGVALAAKMDKKARRVYCLLGDGEINEGQIWEAAMSAGFRRLDNLCAILDYNKLQQDGLTREIKDLEPLREKWRACHWHVIEVDGHNIKGLVSAFDKAERTHGKPTFVIAHTVKGKGVSFMENRAEWHGKAPSEEELQKALREIES